MIKHAPGVVCIACGGAGETKKTSSRGNRFTATCYSCHGAGGPALMKVVDKLRDLEHRLGFIGTLSGDGEIGLQILRVKQELETAVRLCREREMQ